jgi:hypothetical protein
MGEASTNMTAVSRPVPSTGEPTLEVVASPSLLDIKHEAEVRFKLRRGTLGRATRITEYVRARKWFVDVANKWGFSLREIDRFMGWSHNAAAHYLKRKKFK